MNQGLLLQVEHALRRAVDARKNFDNSAGVIAVILGRYVPEENLDALMRELLDFFNSWDK